MWKTAIHLRPATINDAESIVRVHNAAVHGSAGTHYPSDVLASWSPPNDPKRINRVRHAVPLGEELFIVAEVDGRICGFGSIVPSREELRAVYVDADYGRRGIGSEILKRLESLARDRGTKCLKMDASVNAETFYLKHGYAITERGMHQLASGVPMECVKMMKELKQIHA